MKNWILGRRLMAEAGGEGGGGGAGGGEGGAGGSGGGEAPKGDENNGGEGGGEGGENNGGTGEQRPNALGEEANKPGGEGGAEQQPGDKPKEGEQPGDKPAETDPNAPTEEELKAYSEAMKLDEKEFGKDGKLAEGYATRLPAFFKKHGVAPDKVNAMTSDFVRMQKEIDKDAIEKALARNAELDALTEKRNRDFYANYDGAARKDIISGFKWCFPEKSIFREILSKGPAGMDPDILRICQFVGQRLAKDGAPGAAAGAGTGAPKSISDSFMGL